jgi:tRNA (guanine10-N2)-dimethyltransferase
MAILEASRLPYRIVEKAEKLLRLEADIKALEAVAKRSLMFDACGLELMNCSGSKQEILDGVRMIDLQNCISADETFCVRCERTPSASRALRSTELESAIGEIIAQRCDGARVDLKKPDRLFFGLLYNDRFILGLVLQKRAKRSVITRRARARPFFHPSTMQPKLARCLVNLSRPPLGGRALDPFCGVGGILLEAAMIGCVTLGFDIERRMVKAAAANLRHFNLDAAGVIVADARKPPILEVDSIVTDPPYGRGASTHGSTTQEILHTFLPVAADILVPGGHLAISIPTGISLESTEPALRILERHLLRVHRSLTRQIIVLRKKS